MVTNAKLNEKVSFPKSDDEWHSVLDGNVQKAIELRRLLYTQQKHRSFIKAEDIREETNFRPRHVPNELMNLLGTWEAPDYYATGRTRVWVNPRNPHRHLYADVVVKCDCGAPMFRENFSEEMPQPGHVQEHKDDCCKMYRVKARGRLWERRKEVLTEQASYGHALRNIGPRLGYKKTTDQVNKIAEGVGLDSRELQRQGRANIARTLMVLLRDYPTDDLAKAYDISSGTLNNIIREETETDAQKLYSYRRIHDKTDSVMSSA